MLSDPQREFCRTSVRTMQVIIGAMILAVLSFLGYVVFMMPQQGQLPIGAQPIISYAAAAMAVAVTIAWLIVPGNVTSRMRHSLIEDRSLSTSSGNNFSTPEQLGETVPLVGAYQTRLIIGAALLEGAAFFAVTAFMLEHQSFVLYVAGVLLLLLFSQFPTASRLESWVKSESANIQQMRHLR